MNLALGNLTTLKQHLLPNALTTGAALDPVLAAAQQRLVKDDVVAAIGLGVARSFEKFCGRVFQRRVDLTVTISGDRLSYVLPRYPVESVSLVEFKGNAASPWTELVIADVLPGIDLASGLLQFAALQGNHHSQIRITFTGGYWFEDKEPGEAGYPQAMPDGATALPGDLQLAWLLYCQEVWNKRDKLGLNLNTAPDARVGLERLKLPDGIAEMLRDHRRMQLS